MVSEKQTRIKWDELYDCPTLLPWEREREMWGHGTGMCMFQKKKLNRNPSPETWRSMEKTKSVGSLDSQDVTLVLFTLGFVQGHRFCPSWNSVAFCNSDCGCLSNEQILLTPLHPAKTLNTSAWGEKTMANNFPHPFCTQKLFKKFTLLAHRENHSISLSYCSL